MKKVLIFATAYNIAVCSARGGRTLKMAKEVLQPSGRADKR